MNASFLLYFDTELFQQNIEGITCLRQF